MESLFYNCIGSLWIALPSLGHLGGTFIVFLTIDKLSALLGSRLKRFSEEFLNGSW